MSVGQNDRCGVTTFIPSPQHPRGSHGQSGENDTLESVLEKRAWLRDEGNTYVALLLAIVACLSGTTSYKTICFWAIPRDLQSRNNAMSAIHSTTG